MNQSDDRRNSSQQASQQATFPRDAAVSAVQPVSSGISKEHGLVKSSEHIQAAVSEVELPKELEQIGVKRQTETVEIPPDVQKLGVKPAGASLPIVSSPSLPQVTLPITDQQVVDGLHTQVASALLWLAVWCVRKLKKAHLSLKKIHGKIVRVRA